MVILEYAHLVQKTMVYLFALPALFYLVDVPAPSLIDFGKEKSGRDWMVINDGVMGGLSQGQAKLTPNSILFEGNISLDNNGGFSSLRAPYAVQDLSRFKTVEIRYKSSGQRFAFTLEKNVRFYVPNYKVILKTDEKGWITERFDLAGFQEHRLGKKTGGMVTQDILKQIIRVGFINTGKKEGGFTLEVDYIKFR